MLGVVAPPAPSRVPDDCPLTARQLEVLRLVVRGMTYREAAAQLYLTASGVRSHMNCVYRRLGIDGAKGRAPLTALVFARGWLRDVDELLPDYAGAPYDIDGRAFAQPGRPGRNWLAPPAVRLYIDEFDRLLRSRSETAERGTDLYRDVMRRARGIDPPPPRGRDVDAMFRALGAVICTAEQTRLLRHF